MVLRGLQPLSWAKIPIPQIFPGRPINRSSVGPRKPLQGPESNRGTNEGALTKLHQVPPATRRRRADPVVVHLLFNNLTRSTEVL